MAENKDIKDKDEELKKLDAQIKNAHIHIEGMELETSIEDVFEELNNNESFNKEIEQLLADLNEEAIDLTKLQTQILLLIKKYLSRTVSGNLELAIDKHKEILKLDEQLVAADLLELSNHLMRQKSEVAKQMKNNVADLKDKKFQSVSKQSKQDFNRIVKNFAVYEIYKCMNPKRIAGETKQENFAHNFILRGPEVAKKHPGGSKAEIATYSPEFLEKLEKKRSDFKRNSTIER